VLVKAIVFPSLRLFSGVSPAKGQNKGTGREDTTLQIKWEALRVQEWWESKVTFTKSEVNGKVATYQLFALSHHKPNCLVMNKPRTSEQSSTNTATNTQRPKAKDLMLAVYCCVSSSKQEKTTI